MTLEYQLDSLENLDENISNLYIEKDGKFVLDVSGHENAADKGKIPRSRLNEEIQKRKAVEDHMQKIADELRLDVPEEFQDLIPDVAPAEQCKWIRGAQAKGLFDSKEPAPIDNKKPNDKKPESFEGMSPQSIMSMGYKKT